MSQFPSPSLCGDFGLIPVEERIEWREALPRHVLGAMRQVNGDMLPDWKVEEQILPASATIKLLFDSPVPVTLQVVEENFGVEPIAHRRDYAS